MCANISSHSTPSWDLTDLYAGIDDPKIEEDLSHIVSDAAAFETKYKGRISQPELTVELLLEALQTYEKLLADQYQQQASVICLHIERPRPE